MVNKTNQSWIEVLRSIVAGDCASRILLYGPKGTGKSTCGIKMAEAAGKAVYRRECCQQQPIEDWIGSWSLSEGKTVFLKGPIPLAMQSGGVLLCDEFDKRNKSQDSLFHAVMDDPSISSITLPSGEVIKPAPGFLFIATTNEQPSVFSAPLLSRFDCKLHCATTNPAAVESLPDAAAQKMLVNWERQHTPSSEWSCTLDVRAVHAWLRLSKILDKDHAATLVFGKSATEVVSAYGSNV